MPRKQGMRDDDVLARLADLERRMDVMEAAEKSAETEPAKKK
jgi:hypothetical protein